VSGLLTAARYLTTLPLPGNRRDSGPLGAAAGWFPLVGLLLGAVVVGVERVVGALFPGLLAALLIVTAWKLLTGGIHLDGLADCLDGLTGAGPAERLRIMRDSRIGSFGAIGLVLFLGLEVAAVADLDPARRWRALLVAPAIGRAMPLLLGRLYGPARTEGHGAAFIASLGRTPTLIALAFATLVALAALGPPGLVATAVAVLTALAVGYLLSRRLGGVTGDVFGAAVEMSELAVLLTVSAWAHRFGPAAW
jgi:adenosylcobinamide-GDP ribazoletransferase